MTEVILLGTLHFPDRYDIFSEQTQSELNKIADFLFKYKPDKIALEFPPCLQDKFNEIYSNYDTAKLDNDFILDNIVRYGKNTVLSNCNEIVQLGFRLAKKLEHKSIYGIDEDVELSDELFEIIKPHIFKQIDSFSIYYNNELEQTDGSLFSAYRIHNSDKYILKDNELYITANKVNLGNYEGSSFVLQWYERNLKIFSNLQNICSDVNRILVVIGSAHLKILRDFVSCDSSMKLLPCFNNC